MRPEDAAGMQRTDWITSAIDDIKPFAPGAQPIITSKPDRHTAADLRSLMDDDDSGAQSPGPGDDPEEWSRELHRKEVRELFRSARERQYLTLGDTEQERLVLAWRITRELALLLNLLHENEMLIEMQDDGFPVWDVPRGWTFKIARTFNDMRPYTSRRAVRMIEEMYDGEKFPSKDRWPYMQDEKLVETLGLALQPPGVSIAWRTRSGKVAEGYDPDDDRPLTTWLEIVREIADRMGLSKGSKDHPKLGTWGLSPLLSSRIARAAWPHPHDICMFECALVEEVMDLYREETDLGVRRALRRRYGLHNGEIRQVTALAKSVARDTMSEDVEEARALMILRLEGLIQRAKDSLDLRAELAAYKQLAIVQGLGRTDPPDLMTEIVNVIADGSRRRAELRDSNKAALPPGSSGIKQVTNSAPPSA